MLQNIFYCTVEVEDMLQSTCVTDEKNIYSRFASNSESIASYFFQKSSQTYVTRAAGRYNNVQTIIHILTLQYLQLSYIFRISNEEICF